jgi:hypothetical protein
MKELIVKKIIKSYLKKQPGVSKILTEQSLIKDGVVADLIAISPSGEIKYVVECKGSVNPGTLAGGLGQAYQYSYQKQFNQQSKNARVWFACPKDCESILKVFKIPNEVEVFLVEEPSNVFAYIQRGKKRTIIQEFQLPQTFFVEGINLDLIKESIKVIERLQRKRKGKLNRELIKQTLEKFCPRLSSSSHRNTLITLSSLGIIDDDNRLTPEGFRLFGTLKTSEQSFFNEMINIFYSFLINVLNALIVLACDKNQSPNNIECTNEEICKKINELYGQEVRYLNNPRRMNTILHILEEVGAITFINRGHYRINGLIHPTFLPPPRKHK